MPRILYVPNAGQWSLWQLAHQVAANTSKLESRIRAASQIAAGEECDVLVCMWWPYLPLCDKASPKQKLLFVADHYSWRNGSESKFRGILQQANALGVISKRLYWDLERHGLILPGHTFVLPDGVDTQLFAPQELPANFTIGWIGRATSPAITKQKGLDILQKATSILGIQLLTLDAAKAPIAHDQVPAWLSGISAVTWASEAEGTPCPLLEAAACARVPVGTLVGVADEIIEHGKSGLLVERNVEAFKAAFQYLRRLAPVDLKALGQAARLAVLPFDWKLQARKWEEALLELSNTESPRSIPPPVRLLPRKKATQASVSSIITPMEFPIEEVDILAPIERWDWCFEHIARVLERTYGSRRKFDIRLASGARHIKCRVLLAFWWGTVNVRSIQAQRTICCVYDHFSWKTQRVAFQEALDRSQVLCVANKLLLEEIRGFGFKLPHEQYIVPDGVDLALFPVQPFPAKFTVGWAGNSQGAESTTGVSDLKGIRFIEETCRSLGIELLRQDAKLDEAIPHKEMAERFYKNISLYICMSAAEGGPNTIKEAAACGRPSISTPIGDAQEFILQDASGWLVERDTSALTVALCKARDMPTEELRGMGNQARQQAELWSWNSKVTAWYNPLFGNPERKRDASTAVKPKKKLEPEHSPIASFTNRAYPPKRELLENQKPESLLLSDVHGWAFEVGMTDLDCCLRDKMVFSHYCVVFWPKVPFPDQSRYHIIFVPYTRWAIADLLYYDRCVGALRSSCWFADDPNKPPGSEQFSVVNRFRAFQVVTRKSYEQLVEHCPHVYWLPNPVNMKRFPAPTACSELIAVWNGNAGRRNRSGQLVKGFQTHIVPACQQADVPLCFAEFSTNRRTPAQMPAFYQQGSVFVHASLFEGCSKALLEACASGLAVISTDVGQIGEMHKNQLEHFGDTGIVLVPRDPGAIALELVKLRKAGPARVREMGLLNRREVEERWSWDLWAPEYEKFLREALR